MRIVIIVPQRTTISSVAITFLKSYIEKVVRKKIDVVSENCDIPENSDFIIIGSPDRNRKAAEFCDLRQLKNLRHDGYILRTIVKNTRTYVIACGRTENGDKYAVYHLVRELKISGNKIRFPLLNLSMEPFIKSRELIIGDACPWDPFVYADQVSPEEYAETYDIIFNSASCQLNCPDNSRKKYALRKIVEKYCVENWHREKLLDYINQIDSFGFNSIQLGDEAESYMHSGCLVTRRQWREKIVSMMQQAKKIGQRITFMNWGGYAWVQNNIRVVSDWNDPLCNEKAVFSSDFSIKESKCWNTSEGRKNIQAHINYFSPYMKYADHVITHFYDPGGCHVNGCSIGTCIRIMNHQTKIFRKINPNLQVTFNLWPLTSEHEGFDKREVFSNLDVWSGTFNWWYFTKVVDLLEPDIMIANRTFDPEIAEHCFRWDRKYGLWAWYTSDQEITASLHVEAERLGREFSQMPQYAGSALEYISVPSNCHLLNSASIYIAGHLLWNPKKDPFSILQEFCYCVFGPEISEAIYAGYHAIARIRNHDIKGDSAFSDAYLGAGTPDVEKDIEISGDALYKLNKISIDQNWHSKIPIIADRSTMLEDLREHVKMVHQYAEFRHAYARLARKSRITGSDVKTLPVVDRFKNTGGMIEWRKAKWLLNLL
ncbi:MAG: alpha-glucuronidase family glycosyl hydrolase [Candidatus Ratteibacteria bacterium]